MHHLPTIKSNEQDDLRSLFVHFDNKPFIISEAQGFPQACIINAYKREEEAFKKTVREVRRDIVTKEANIISPHVLYEIKLNDDKTLKL